MNLRISKRNMKKSTAIGSNVTYMKQFGKNITFKLIIHNNQDKTIYLKEGD